jgi:hypothetical protein
MSEPTLKVSSVLFELDAHGAEAIQAITTPLSMFFAALALAVILFAAKRWTVLQLVPRFFGALTSRLS